MAVKRYDQFRFHLEIGHALIGGYSSWKRDYSRCNTDTLGNNPVNVNLHENVHMNAKHAKRCVFHAKVDSNMKKIYETAYGCKLCNVHLCKTCHQPFHDRK